VQTRDPVGTPIAGITRTEHAAPAFERAQARVAAAGLRDASRGTSLGGLSIRGLIDEGRR
jgi:hypothetical protein